MLSIAHNFLFVHVPKTAGNSVQRVLLDYSEDEMVLRGAHQDGVERFELRSPTVNTHKHSTLANYHAELPRSQFDGLFKFHGVRNPWDRCVSFFFSPHRGRVDWSPEAFERFINTTVIPTHDFLRLDKDDADPFANMDAVIRYEHLAEDFEAVCRQIGIPPPKLPHANASVREAYQKYYSNDALIALVAERFAPEINRFHYRFEP
jgi:hypothetical protein